jgi:hypothetical protein
MKKKKILAVTLAILLPAESLAEGLQALPKWHMCGQEACYSFEEAKQLLVLDSELLMHRDVSAKLKLLNTDLHLAVDALKISLDQQKAATQVILDNNKILEEQLKTAIIEKNKAEANRAPGLGWAVAGSLALVIVGVVVGHYLWPKTEVVTSTPPAQ